MKVLSLCSSAGMLDMAFIRQGFEVVPGCELNPNKRHIYQQWIGGEFLCHDIKQLPSVINGEYFDLVIGGPPCQALSKLRARHKPKYPDLTEDVQKVMDCIHYDGFIFENVTPLNIDGALHTKRCASDYPEKFAGREIHQSRPRWFTHSKNIQPPSAEPNNAFVYPAVTGKIYGLKRAAILQGYPELIDIEAPYEHIREALADGVPRGLADAWARQAKMAKLG